MKMYNWEQAQMQHMKASEPSYLSIPLSLLPSLPIYIYIYIYHLHPPSLSLSLSLPPSLPPSLPAQDYVARFGHGSAKLARQAQSKEKVLAKMVAGGLTEKVQKDKVDQPLAVSCCGMEDSESDLWDVSYSILHTGGLVFIPRLWHNPSTCDHGAGC